MLENITQIWVQISESSFTNLTYQKEARVEVIIQWLTERHKWMETVFSDKKRFSLDSPDSWCTYATVNEINIRQIRQCGGACVLVWAMVMPNGLISHKIIRKNHKFIWLFMSFERTSHSNH